MKNKNTTIPATSKLNLLRQIGNLIPDFLVPHLAGQTGVHDKARSFSPWSHLLALMYAQLAHSIGLNDLCDALALHSGPFSSLRGAIKGLHFRYQKVQPGVFGLRGVSFRQAESVTSWTVG